MENNSVAPPGVERFRTLAQWLARQACLSDHVSAFARDSAEAFLNRSCADLRRLGYPAAEAAEEALGQLAGARTLLRVFPREPWAWRRLFARVAAEGGACSMLILGLWAMYPETGTMLASVFASLYVIGAASEFTESIQTGRIPIFVSGGIVRGRPRGVRRPFAAGEIESAEQLNRFIYRQARLRLSNGRIVKVRDTCDGGKWLLLVAHALNPAFPGIQYALRLRTIRPWRGGFRPHQLAALLLLALAAPAVLWGAPAIWSGEGASLLFVLGFFAIVAAGLLLVANFRPLARGLLPIAPFVISVLAGGALLNGIVNGRLEMLRWSVVGLVAALTGYALALLWPGRKRVPIIASLLLAAAFLAAKPICFTVPPKLAFEFPYSRQVVQFEWSADAEFVMELKGEASIHKSRFLHEALVMQPSGASHTILLGADEWQMVRDPAGRVLAYRAENGSDPQGRMRLRTQTLTGDSHSSPSAAPPPQTPPWAPHALRVPGLLGLRYAILDFRELVVLPFSFATFAFKRWLDDRSVLASNLEWDPDESAGRQFLQLQTWAVDLETSRAKLLRQIPIKPFDLDWPLWGSEHSLLTTNLEKGADTVRIAFLNPANGERTSLPDAYKPTEAYFIFDWAPQSQIMLFPSRLDGHYWMNLAKPGDPRIRSIALPKNAKPELFRLSPDGSRAAIYIRSQGLWAYAALRLCIWDIETGAFRVLQAIPPPDDIAYINAKWSPDGQWLAHWRLQQDTTLIGDPNYRNHVEIAPAAD